MKSACLLLIFAAWRVLNRAHIVFMSGTRPGKVEYACAREERSDHIGWDGKLGTLVFVKLGPESLSYRAEAGVKSVRVIRTARGWFLGFPPMRKVPYYWRRVPVSLPL